MNYVKLLLYLEAITCSVAGVKVNMQGSLSLGKEVLDSLSYYLGNNLLSSRRFLMPVPIEDSITLVVRSAQLCKDLDFCQDEFEHFVNEYVVILAKAVQNVFSNSLTVFSTERYEDHLKHSMEYIRHILEDTNTKAVNSVSYYWIQAIKKISVIFQEMLNVFTTNLNKSNDTNAVTILNHKIVIATTFIERKYEIKMCSEYNFCLESYECTKALNKILIHFKTLSEDKIRLFVKYFYESLFDTSFYGYLSETTAHDFQIILNDMAYANGTSTKDIMLSVQKTVEARLEIVQLNKGLQVAHDILIAHVILSDLDHFYSNHSEPFIMFHNQFYGWLSSDASLGKHVRAVMANISKEIWSHDKDLISKLIREVKVFLEMTSGMMNE